jgi:hypothetical protein
VADTSDTVSVLLYVQRAKFYDTSSLHHEVSIEDALVDVTRNRCSTTTEWRCSIYAT